jgi:hypothetical protein
LVSLTLTHRLFPHQTIDVYEMCGDTLKAALRVNREIADKKNEAIFAAKRAKMGDIEPSTGGKATATASATATAAEPC